MAILYHGRYNGRRSQGEGQRRAWEPVSAAQLKKQCELREAAHVPGTSSLHGRSARRGGYRDGVAVGEALPEGAAVLVGVPVGGC